VANSRAYPTQELVDKKISEEDIQPFSFGRWTVSHNGIISNDNEIAEKFGIHRTTQTDTAVIPIALEQYFRDRPPLIHEVAEFFKNEVEGSFAMILYRTGDGDSSDRMFFVTNFMPLYYVWDSKKRIIYAFSEPEMAPAEFLIHRPLNDRYRFGQFGPYTVNEIVNDELVSADFRRHNTDMNKVIISFSGGNDSMVNARLYQALGYDVHLLHFKYGQRAETVEQWSSQIIATEWKMPLHIVDLREMFAQISKGSVLLNKDFNLPTEQRLFDAETTFSYIANRNMIFASIMGGLAEQIGARTAVVNINLGDSVYPDNNYTFMRQVENLFNYSLKPHTKVRFTSPLVNMEKHEIIRLGLFLNADFYNSVSCYYPELTGPEGTEVVNCGHCGCCLYRERAFKMVGTVDPQTYKEGGKRDWSDCTNLNGTYQKNSHDPLRMIPITTSERVVNILERVKLFI